MNARQRHILAGLALLLVAAGMTHSQTVARPDSLPPVFRSDSSGSAAIRAVEAGESPKDTLRSLARADSLRNKLLRRGPYIGLTAAAAFGRHSARERFASHMETTRAANGQTVLQEQDPVHVFFPGGLLIGIPVLPHFDALLRTEHFYYRIAGLAQKDNEPPTEFWFTQQAHLAGVGLRWLVPGSLITVNGEGGLYVSYTRFWNFGSTGMRSPDGSLRARTNPAGAGQEIQVGFQQDFDKRWALTGGLAYSQLTFRSDADWDYIVPTTPPGQQAEWTLQSMRFVLQGLYQFGRQNANAK